MTFSLSCGLHRLLTIGLKNAEYREAISLLRKGYSIRYVAKLGGKEVSTVQRVKKEFVDIILY